MTARGVRSHNPGNVVRDDTRWQGMAADQSSDPRFVVFTSPVYGIRAMAVILLAYQTKHGLNTVRGIIGRWAPPSENNTGAYVSAVAGAMRVGPDDPLDLEKAETMVPLVKAIIVHEDAGYIYPDATVAEGVRLAGIADAKPPPMMSKPAVQAQAGGVAAAATAAAVHYGALATQAAPTIKAGADKLSDFTGSPFVQHVVTVMLTVAGGLVLVGWAASLLDQKRLA